MTVRNKYVQTNVYAAYLYGQCGGGGFFEISETEGSHEKCSDGDT